MPLIDCKECNSPISDKAPTCPKCGFVLLKYKQNAFAKILKWLFISINLFMLFLFVAVAWFAPTYSSTLAEFFTLFISPDLVDLLPIDFFVKILSLAWTAIALIVILFLWANMVVVMGTFLFFSRSQK